MRVFNLSQPRTWTELVTGLSGAFLVASEVSLSGLWGYRVWDGVGIWEMGNVRPQGEGVN